MHTPHSIFSTPRQDVIAGVVVFLVALPLCLGIAIASGAPPVSGLVAGIVGGLVVPILSRSPLSVCGPAAGLAAIVLMQITALGGIATFLLAVVLAGAIQFAMGLLKAGRLSALVPSSVVKGMLAAIGITIVLKQLPYAFGHTGALLDAVRAPHPGALAIAAVALVILYGWKRTPLGRYHFLSPPLIAVVVGSVMAWAMGDSSMALASTLFVDVPNGDLGALVAQLPSPDFAGIGRADVWIAAGTIAVVASIETLLSLQAVDRLDPRRRHSPPDRELLAQGLGNAVSGLCGGLPITSVIVRSGANVAAGGQDRLAAIVHGLLLFLAVVFAGDLLERIPLAALAAVLIQVGLNLCKPALFVNQSRLGINQMLPFVATIAAVMATDLLKGVVIGILVGIAFVLRQNAQDAVRAATDTDGTLRLRFRRDATFITKPALLAALDEAEDGGRVVIDATGEYVDHDVKEALAAFVDDAKHRGVRVELVGVDLGNAAPGGH
jgi:MFS superfamily sulfate permease-like transporter